MTENRTFDGRFNNRQQPNWGRAGERLLRLTTPAYVAGDGLSGPDRPNPRVISNIVCREGRNKSVPSRDKLSHYVWAWGQFLDHELDITEGADPAEDASFHAPPDDPDLPNGLIRFGRSIYDRSTGTGPDNPRRQLNQLSSYIDGANVYGADHTRAAVLRSGSDGKLKTIKPTGGKEKRDLLPLNKYGLPNARVGPAPADTFFAAGDIRANEHSVLTCMHTLFVREHNRQCDLLAKDAGFQKSLAGKSPGERDEETYQRARRIVGAEMQVITYEEFLPALLGKNALSPFAGYNSAVNAHISNIFSTACYRLGHTMLPSTIPLIHGKKTTKLKLREAFFTPSLIEKHGVDAFLRGLASERQQEIDNLIVEEVRTFLFRILPDKPGELLDLAALNIQRGRDHGLPDYNQCRADFGLSRKTGFGTISASRRTNLRLKRAYEGNIDAIDPWVGAISEAHVKGSAVGELVFTVLKDQFERLRDGDRFYYENDPEFTAQQKSQLKKIRLSDIIKANSGYKNPPADVFRA